jgi:D-alanyl-D-alanine carboxypeptidase/D-alanyl-D-alanine-endopeptidase (penicillin-binding protein 4)
VLARGRVSTHHAGSRHHCRVVHPTWYTGHSFRNALNHEGIRTRRTVRRGAVPAWADLIYTLRSPALGELVRKVNKRSQNFMAEQLYKTLGAEFLGVPGSWWKGQQVLNAFLDEEVGIPTGSYVLHNGSGLNDVNRVTASQVVTLLSYMWERFDVRPDFLASLAVAGADGTVWGRFTHPTVARTMRLKTGSLASVRSLAGYVHSRGNEVFAFSLLVSNYSCRGYQVNRLIDRFASALSRADRNLQVEEEIEVLPIVSPQGSPIGPAEPPEGTEESEIPIGEVD